MSIKDIILIIICIIATALFLYVVVTQDKKELTNGKFIISIIFCIIEFIIFLYLYYQMPVLP